MGSVLTPGVAGVAGLHSPGDFGPLAAAAVVESDRLRKAIRCACLVLMFSLLLLLYGGKNNCFGERERENARGGDTGGTDVFAMLMFDLAHHPTSAWKTMNRQYITCKWWPQ